MRHLREMEAVVAAAPDGQVSLTDPDARAMTISGRGTTVVGYNVQAAVDTTHHLIVAHEVTNATSDRAQLEPMGKLAQEATGRTALTVLADRGYFAGRQVVACEKGGMMPYVPKQDAYRCPAGQTLKWWFNRVDEKGMTLRHYWTTTCPECPIKAQCTPGQDAPGHPLGARGRAGCNAEAARPSAAGNDPAAANGGAPVRHHQGLGGCHALPEPDAETGRHGDELAGFGLQHEWSSRSWVSGH